MLARSREGIDHLALSPDGTRVALASGTVALVDTTGGGVMGEFRPHRDQPYHVDFDPRGERLASCSTDGTLALLDTRPLRERRLAAEAWREARERATRWVHDRMGFGSRSARLADEVCADETATAAWRAVVLEALTLAANRED